MKQSLRFRLFVAAALLTPGCAPKIQTAPASAPAAPAAAKSSLVLLMQDPDGKTGQVVVRNAGGTVQLDQKNSVASITKQDSVPANTGLMDDAEIQRRFGGALNALPQAEVRVTLHFLEDGDNVAPESIALLGEIKRMIQERRSTYVSITGHTDTTGSNEYNFRLGLRRAEKAAEVVKAAGVPVGAIFVSSSGEGDLLVPTADNVDEPKNRRVEIVIR